MNTFAAGNKPKERATTKEELFFFFLNFSDILSSTDHTHTASTPVVFKDDQKPVTERSLSSRSEEII